MFEVLIASKRRRVLMPSLHDTDLQECTYCAATFSSLLSRAICVNCLRQARELGDFADDCQEREIHGG